MVPPIPAGYRNVTPYLVNDHADKVIHFLQRAFGATASFPPMMRSDGAVAHAEMRIGDSVLMLGEARGGCPPMPACFYLYVDDVDRSYRRALQAGGVSVFEPRDQFYGDRSGAVRDPGGNTWWIATHKEDVPERELTRRFEASVAYQGAL